MRIPVTVTIQPPPLAQAVMRGVDPSSVPHLFPHTLQRLMELAQAGVGIWREKAMGIPGQEGRPLRLGTGSSDPMIRLNKTDYANSISVMPADMSADETEVVIGTDDRQALPIEIGGPSIDLHAVLDYAPKARMSKKGSKYLRIPFRHAVKTATSSGRRFQTASNVIPPKIYASLRNKKPSLIVGHRSEKSVNYPGQTVQRNVYAQGAGRVTRDNLLMAGIGPGTKKGKRLLGLMKIGKGGHGGHITIRTMSAANPSGWRVGPYPAQKLAHETAQELQRLAQNWFEQALRDDAAGWVQEAAS